MINNVPLLLQLSLFYRAFGKRVKNFRSNVGTFLQYQTSRSHFTHSNNL